MSSQEYMFDSFGDSGSVRTPHAATAASLFSSTGVPCGNWSGVLKVRQAYSWVCPTPKGWPWGLSSGNRRPAFPSCLCLPQVSCGLLNKALSSPPPRLFPLWGMGGVKGFLHCSALLQAGPGGQEDPVRLIVALSPSWFLGNWNPIQFTSLPPSSPLRRHVCLVNWILDAVSHFLTGGRIPAFGAFIYLSNKQ